MFPDASPQAEEDDREQCGNVLGILSDLAFESFRELLLYFSHESQVQDSCLVSVPSSSLVFRKNSAKLPHTGQPETVSEIIAG